MDPQILAYVREQVRAGYAADEIRRALLRAGWSPNEVSQAVLEVEKERTSRAPQAVIKEPPVSNMPSLAELQRNAVRPVSPGTFSKDKSPAPSTFAIGILSALAILVVGGGVFAYFTYFKQPSYTPEQVLEKMTANLSTLKSLSYGGTVELNSSGGVAAGPAEHLLGAILYAAKDTIVFPTAPPKNQDHFKIKLGFDGASDFYDEKNPKSNVALTLQGSGSLGSVPNGTVTANLEFRYVGNTLFARLANFSVTGVQGLGLLSSVSFGSQWVKFDADTLKNEVSGFGLPATPAPSPEASARVQSLLKQAHIVKITEDLGKDSLDGASTYHYRLGVNKDALKQFFIAVASASGDPLQGVQADQLTTLLDQSHLPGGEIWIGTGDFMPHKLAITLDIDRTSAYEQGRAQMTITTAMSKFNEPVTVLPPDSFKNLSDLLAPYFAQVHQKGMDTRRISDLKMIQNALELYYQKCGYYPGTVQKGQCGRFVKVKNWDELNAALTGSNIGVNLTPQTDPAEKNRYVYATNGSGSEYVLGVRLDDASNVALQESPKGKILGVDCSGSVYCTRL